MQTEQPVKPGTGEGVGVFDDTAGRRWQIKINVATVRHLRTAHNLDLLKILDREANPFAQLADDPLRLCDVLWTLIKAQAVEAGISELQWLEAMAGDVLTSAAYALMEATIDFFPKHRRAPLAAMLMKMKAAESTLTRKMTDLVESKETDQAIADHLNRAEEAASRRLQTVLNGRGT